MMSGAARWQRRTGSLANELSVDMKSSVVAAGNPEIESWRTLSRSSAGKTGVLRAND